MRKLILALGLLLSYLASAQEAYLMPSFADGMVLFRGQAPAKGKLNINAIDHTLRFMDASGKELAAANPENIVKVQIDTAVFLHYQNYFYRIYPVKSDVGVALLRNAHIVRDAKQGAYGTTSQTSAIKGSGTMYVDGILYNLDNDKDLNLSVTETLFMYKGDTVYPLTKRSLKKVFPDKKEQIEAFFKSGGSVPEDIAGVKAFISGWME